MMKSENNTREERLQKLCAAVRKYTAARNYPKCAAMISEAMMKFPNAPEPHNLLGIVLEKEGDHAGAMKHFRAAYALDPNYIPARQNLETYGTFFAGGRCAFDESDCPKTEPFYDAAPHDKKEIRITFGREKK